jgi:hypothetical protein
MCDCDLKSTNELVDVVTVTTASNGILVMVDYTPIRSFSAMQVQGTFCVTEKALI